MTKATLSSCKEFRQNCFSFSVLFSCFLLEIILFFMLDELRGVRERCRLGVTDRATSDECVECLCVGKNMQG